MTTIVTCVCLCVCVPKDEDSFNDVFMRASYRTHIFRNRVKLETYNVSFSFVIT